MQVFIAHNNEIIRFGLCKIVESLAMCSHIQSGHSNALLREDINWARFDLIILNRLMRKDNISNFIAKLKSAQTDVKILALSDQTSYPEMQFLFSLGIKGYIESSASLDVIRKAVEVVLSGMLYVEPSMLVSYSDDSSCSRNSSESIYGRKLSGKELEIAILLSAGLKTAEISGILERKASTISAHKRNIFSKLRVNNVVELMRYMDFSQEVDLALQ